MLAAFVSLLLGWGAPTAAAQQSFDTFDDWPGLCTVPEPGCNDGYVTATEGLGLGTFERIECEPGNWCLEAIWYGNEQERTFVPGWQPSGSREIYLQMQVWFGDDYVDAVEGWVGGVYQPLALVHGDGFRLALLLWDDSHTPGVELRVINEIPTSGSISIDEVRCAIDPFVPPPRTWQDIAMWLRLGDVPGTDECAVWVGAFASSGSDMNLRGDLGLADPGFDSVEILQRISNQANVGPCGDEGNPWPPCMTSVTTRTIRLDDVCVASSLDARSGFCRSGGGGGGGGGGARPRQVFRGGGGCSAADDRPQTGLLAVALTLVTAARRRRRGGSNSRRPRCDPAVPASRRPSTPRADRCS